MANKLNPLKEIRKQLDKVISALRITDTEISNELAEIDVKLSKIERRLKR